MIVAVFVLGCDFGFAGDASIAPARQNFALICSILVGICSDRVGCVIRKFLQNDFLNIFTNATKHFKMKNILRKIFSMKNILYLKIFYIKTNKAVDSLQGNVTYTITFISFFHNN